MEEEAVTEGGAQKNGSNMKIIVLIVGVVVILGGGFLYFSGKKAANVPAQSAPSATPSEAVSAFPSEATESANVKEFEVVGKPFSLTPSQIKVKVGDTVKIVFKNSEGFHDFGIDEYSVRTKQIKAGESEQVSFVADKVGTFQFYCGVGTHRQMGMKGNLVVE